MPAKFIIRLDDACPEMNPARWNEMERLLTRFDVRPLVGVIPDNKDPSFTWESDPFFWTTTIIRWQEKKWSFAQHGTHHAIYKATPQGEYSEFHGKPLQEQIDLLRIGHEKLLSHGISPSCFFAPCHTYDSNTYAALKELGCFNFISDGYAFKHFNEHELLFLPTLFDTPHKILPFGIYTFVFHPNYTTDQQFEYLEKFLEKNRNHIVSADDYVNTIQSNRHRNVVEKAIEPTINLIRKIRH